MMRQPQRERLLRILRTQSVSRQTKRMRGVMKELLEDAGMEVRVENQQIFARKGSAEQIPFIVAHADTVHKIVPSHNYRVVFDLMDGEVVHHAYDPATGKRRGVGGDDKCGLWIAQEIARNLDNVGVIITVDEEIGCIGARRVTSKHLADATVLIQADRRGHDDAVTRASGINISSDSWQDHVKKGVEGFGYKYCTFGAGTDVAAMHDTKAAQVSAINLSAAYYAPHSDDEYIREDKLENAFELAIRLAELSSGEKWAHEAKRHVYNNQNCSTYYANGWVSPLDYFSNKPEALRAGYHATHLIRDSALNRPKHDEWAYHNEYRMQMSKDGTSCLVYLSGGYLILSIVEFNLIIEFIKATAWELPRSDFYRGHLKPTAHTFVSEFLNERVVQAMRKEEAPTCGLVQGCSEKAKVYHCVRLAWGCDLHIRETMEEDGLQYKSERPSPVAVALPSGQKPLDELSPLWYP